MILDLEQKIRFIVFRFLTRLCWISIGDSCFWDRRQNLFHRCNSGHEQQQADGRRKIQSIICSLFANVQVFLGAISALAVMTILSALLGFVVTTFIPREYTYYTCTAIMFLFGVKVWEILILNHSNPPFRCCGRRGRWNPTRVRRRRERWRRRWQPGEFVRWIKEKRVTQRERERESERER